MQEDREKKVGRKVIVRAWGDEPVALYSYNAASKDIYVGNESGKATIGLPFDQVFSYHEALFSTASCAFVGGDISKLLSTYDGLSKTCPCNRYKNTLESAHDQEHITDSRGFGSSRE